MRYFITSDRLALAGVTTQPRAAATVRWVSLRPEQGVSGREVEELRIKVKKLNRSTHYADAVADHAFCNRFAIE